MFIDRRATAICASLRAASLLIDSQSLIGNGALFESDNGRGSMFVPALS
jgi:hypothetical protein